VKAGRKNSAGAMDDRRQLTREAVVRALARSEVFAGLGADDLDRLASECRVHRFATGEQVFARGDRGGGMFLVGQGSVALSVTSAEGREVLLALVEPPRTFGEMAVIDGGPRVATATARRPSVIVAIPPASVLRVLRENPDVALSLLGSLAALIRRLDEQNSDLVITDLSGRVSKFLLTAAADRNGPASAGVFVPVEVPLTQTELARLVGGSRQQVNRVIRALEATGAVRRSGPRIVAVRPDLLES
jgi:CRP/FNR family transcriptional regulator, cyclic AMP receptor protein